MKVLFLAPRVPFPLTRGDSLRIYNIIQEIRKSHKVGLVSISNSNKRISDIEEIDSLVDYSKTIKRSKMKSYLGIPYSMMRYRKSVNESFYFSNRINEAIRNSVDSFDPKCLFSFFIRMSQYVERKYEDILKVVDLVDCYSYRYKERSKKEYFPISMIYKIESILVGQSERLSIRLNDECIISSRQDKKRICNGNNKDNLSVVNNGVSIEQFEFVTSEERPKNVILFHGNMSYHPNIDAVCFFVSEVIPIIVDKYPNTMFKVVGKKPSSKVLSLDNNSNVSVTGFVESMQSELANATISVAPLRLGVGIQNKVLEAMASGIPVVCSSKAAAPITGSRNSPLQVADSPQAFASKIFALLESSELRDELAKKARSLIEKKFSWEAAGNRINKLLEN